MRKAVRAIIVNDHKLLVMKRNKFGHEYYILVGGGIDFGETPDMALAREVREEAGLEISNPRLVFIQEAGDPYGTQYIYLCDYVGGDPMLDPKSAEASIHSMGQNLYETMWLPIDQLKQVPFVAEVLREALLEGLANGFPDEPKTLYGGA